MKTSENQQSLKEIEESPQKYQRWSATSHSKLWGRMD